MAKKSSRRKTKNTPKLIGLLGIAAFLSLLAVMIIGGGDPSSSFPQTELVQEGFVYRNYTATPDDPYYSMIVAVSDDTLQQIRCTDIFINTGTNHYFWRPTYSHDLEDEVLEPTFQQAIAAIEQGLPAGRILLSGNFCQSETGTLLLSYATADARSDIGRGYYHGDDVEMFVQTVLNQRNQSEPAILVGQVDGTWPYGGCNKPIQLSKDEVVYLVCSIARNNGSESMLYAVDLSRQTSIQLSACTYSYANGLHATCQ